MTASFFRFLGVWGVARGTSMDPRGIVGLAGGAPSRGMGESKALKFGYSDQKMQQNSLPAQTMLHFLI